MDDVEDLEVNTQDTKIYGRAKNKNRSRQKGKRCAAASSEAVDLARNEEVAERSVNLDAAEVKRELDTPISCFTVYSRKEGSNMARSVGIESSITTSAKVAVSMIASSDDQQEDKATTSNVTDKQTNATVNSSTKEGLFFLLFYACFFFSSTWSTLRLKKHTG